MTRRLQSLVWVAAAALMAAAIVFEWTPLLRGPAPYPPEWRWELRTEPTSGRYLPALGFAVGLLGLLGWSGSGRARRRPRAAAWILLCLGTALGWGFSIGLVALEPVGAMRTLMGRVSSRTVTSYLRVAASADARDPGDFLDRHAERLPHYRKLAKHAATHPPGPVLYYRGLIGLCEASPSLTHRLLGAAGLDPEGRPANRPPLTREARAAGLLGALLILFMGAATAWAVAAIAERTGLDALSAARTGLLWTVIPGAVLMAPQFDQALALPVGLATAGLAAATQSPSLGRAVGLSVLAGLVGGLATALSYGAVVFLLTGGLAALALASWPSRPAETTSRSLVVGAVAVTTALGVFLLPSLWGHEPIRALRTALAIHREAYTLPRSYGLWLIFNPVDLGVFLGAPLAVALAWRAVELARSGSTGLCQRTGRLRLAVLAGLCLLLASGTVRGEVGRIWIPLMPLLLIAAVAEEPTRNGTEPARRAHPTAGEATLMAALLAGLCLILRTFWQVY